MEELKELLDKNKQQEVKPVAEPKQTNKTKKVIEREPESETESESEEEIIVKKKPKPKAKTKKKVTVYLSSDDDESESDYEAPPPKQKSRIQRPNQIQPVAQVQPAIDYKSFFC
jgi:trehalose/maltose hydrolase-like predicted phosphorylase